MPGFLQRGGGRRVYRSRGGGGAAILANPDAAFDFLPFDIIDNLDGTYSVDPSFNLQSYAGISVSKTYHVAKTGLDTNDGLTFATAFLTLTKALGMADVDRIYVYAGKWGFQQGGFADTNPARSVEIIGVGDHVHFDQDIYAQSSAWTHVDNHYTGTYGVAPYAAVIDTSVTDSNGIYIMYTKVTSEAEVEATAGTWWANPTGKINYIRTIDDRAPDNSLRFLYNSYGMLSTARNGITLYIKNIDYYGAKTKLNSAGGGGTKIFFEDCLLHGLNVASQEWGGLEVGTISEGIILNSRICKTSDVDGIHINSTAIVPNWIEIGCQIHNCGVSGTAINASSAHGGNIVRINGIYYTTSGRTVHDIQTNGKTWNVGMEAHHGTYSNFESGAGAYMWCDTCNSHDNATADYIGNGAPNMFLHNCIGATRTNCTDY